MIQKIGLTRILKIPSTKILQSWVSWLNDRKVSNFSARSAKKHTINTQIKFLKEKIQQKHIIFLVSKNKIPIGVLELCNIDKINKNCEIRYLIGNTSFWGQGIGTRVVDLGVHYAFNKLYLNLIYADTHQDNLASQRILKKIGFKVQGKIKKFFYHKNKPKNKIIFVKNK